MRTILVKPAAILAGILFVACIMTGATPLALATTYEISFTGTAEYFSSIYPPGSQTGGFQQFSITGKSIFDTSFPGGTDGPAPVVPNAGVMRYLGVTNGSISISSSTNNFIASSYGNNLIITTDMEISGDYYDMHRNYMEAYNSSRTIWNGAELLFEDYNGNTLPNNELIQSGTTLNNFPTTMRFNLEKWVWSAPHWRGDTADLISYENIFGTIGTVTDARIVDSPSPVPIPNALWLFGSGVAGLIGLKRRKPKF